MWSHVGAARLLKKRIAARIKNTEIGASLEEENNKKTPVPRETPSA